MSDELDLLTRARDRLIELDRDAVDGPWGAEFMTPKASGAIWQLRAEGAPGIRMQVYEYQHGIANAYLIVALRRCVPHLIAMLDVAVAYAEGGGKSSQQAELNLARAILGETEGQNNG